jgi:phage anti-repressor protein
MNELIKVNKEGERITVLGRDLHKFLEIETKYMDWFPRMIGYGFEENIDYKVISQKREIGIGKGLADHQLTLDMAKEISMLQRNEKGKQARKYFIECEKKINKPMTMVEIVAYNANKLVEMEREQLEIQNRLNILEAKQTNSPYEFFSIVAYCNLNNIKCELRQASDWGREATKLCHFNDR